MWFQRQIVSSQSNCKTSILSAWSSRFNHHPNSISFSPRLKCWDWFVHPHPKEKGPWVHFHSQDPFSSLFSLCPACNHYFSVLCLQDYDPNIHACWGQGFLCQLFPPLFSFTFSLVSSNLDSSWHFNKLFLLKTKEAKGEGIFLSSQTLAGGGDFKGQPLGFTVSLNQPVLHCILL